jgi:CelD/BcsL family acetyltransferase involved in cellulose biosynthesis
MSTLLQRAEPQAGAGVASNPYVAEVGADVETFVARCARLADGATLPFHTANWLRAWYDTFGRAGGRTPVLVAVRHRRPAGEGGADAVLLPLVARREHGSSVLEFADGGVVDYVAPLLAPHWHGGLPEQEAAQALWRAVRAALQGHDLLRVHKMLGHMLEEQGGGPNPLALALRTSPCEMFGNQFSVPQGTDWETWRRSLDKRVRKEIERCWRVFQRSPEARFDRVTDPAQALALFETLEQQQSQRMQTLQPNYLLDAPECRAFYRQAIAGGVASGEVVLTALRDGEHVVSALFGLANGHRYVGLRQSLGGDAWKTCSPARLLDEQTARHLHDQGRQHFDFGIGDYHHKQALQMTSIPLMDACQALSPRGVPAALAWRARRKLKQQAWLVAAKRRLAGAPSH